MRQKSSSKGNRYNFLKRKYLRGCLHVKVFASVCFTAKVNSWSKKTRTNTDKTHWVSFRSCKMYVDLSFDFLLAQVSRCFILSPFLQRWLNTRINKRKNISKMLTVHVNSCSRGCPIYTLYHFNHFLLHFIVSQRIWWHFCVAHSSRWSWPRKSIKPWRAPYFLVHKTL